MSDKDLSTIIAEVRETLGKMTPEGIATLPLWPQTILNNLPALLTALEARTEALEDIEAMGTIESDRQTERARAALTTPVQSPLGDGSERELTE